MLKMTVSDSTRFNDGPVPVSVIVPVYNGGEAVRRCAASLLNQEYPEDLLEIIIVDDGSQDGTAEWLQTAEWPEHVKIVCHNENRGRGQARNSGIGSSTGDILIFLDADMVVQPNFVKAHVAVLESDDVAAVTGAMELDSRLPESKISRYFYGYRGRGARQFEENRPIPFQYLLTGNLSVKRTALENIGGFDESFHVYGGEDTVFAYRLAQAYPHGFRFSRKPLAADQHVPDLNTVLTKLETYGAENLPRMLADTPEMMIPLHGHWVFGSRWQRFCGRLLFHRFGEAAARIKLSILPPPFSHWMIRYLMAAALFRGLRRSRRLHTGHEDIRQ